VIRRFKNSRKTFRHFPMDCMCWTHRRLSLSPVRVCVNVLAYVPTSRRDRYNWPIREEKWDWSRSGRAWSGHRGEFRSPKRRERNEIDKCERFVSETHVSADSLSAALSRPRRGSASRSWETCDTDDATRCDACGACVQYVRALVRPLRHVRGKRDAGHEKKYRPDKKPITSTVWTTDAPADRHYSWNVAASWPLKLSFIEARDKSRSVARKKTALTETAFHLTLATLLESFRPCYLSNVDKCGQIDAHEWLRELMHFEKRHIWGRKDSNKPDNFENV